MKNIITTLLSAGILGGAGYGLYTAYDAVTSLPKCDSKFAENNVITIFKQNNDYYKRVSDFGVIKNISMSNIVPVSYDKELKKYVCTAKLTMNPALSYGITSDTFKCKNNDPFCYGLPEGTYAARDCWYENATCNVKFTVYEERGEKKVISSYCSGGFDKIQFIGPKQNTEGYVKLQYANK